MTSSSRNDPHRLADELEREVDRLEQHAREVGEQTEAARDTWERKRRDPSVPGAQPPESDQLDDSDEQADDASGQVDDATAQADDRG